MQVRVSAVLVEEIIVKNKKFSKEILAEVE